MIRKFEFGTKKMTNTPKNLKASATIRWTRQLLKDGYCIIRDAVPVAQIEELNRELNERFVRTPFCEGNFYGRHTKRIGSLISRSTVAVDLIRHRLILGITEQVLKPWCDCFNLNLTQGIEIHSGALAQFPHRDQDMWQGAKATSNIF
jgi:hypothetical protein